MTAMALAFEWASHARPLVDDRGDVAAVPRKSDEARSEPDDGGGQRRARSAKYRAIRPRAYQTPGARR